MLYIALSYCSKFQKNLTHLGELWLENHPEVACNDSFCCYKDNLATTNTILVKFTTIMYLHTTFHLTKNWGVTRRAWEDVS